MGLSERRQIAALHQQGHTCALVTLVRVEGSSYRRPGAHLLIASNGDFAGSISGGCLESELVRKAQWKVRNGAILETYSTLFDDTAEIPYGLGCGGVVDLLLEPTNTPEAHALFSALEASLHGASARALTWLPTATQPLRRAILAPDNTILFATPTLTPAEIAACTSTQTRVPHSSRSDEWENEPPTPPNTPFLQLIAPPQRLLIFGAGEDARPLVAFAHLLGWTSIVLDGRPTLARAERFPHAAHVGATLSEVTLQPTDAAVLVTHSYQQDRDALLQLLAAYPSPGYIGLLGARHRSALLLSEAATALSLPLEAACNRVWAPVGLDLGGDGPTAIALAIIAEIQAFLAGKLPRSRRLDPAEIANQIARQGASAYLQTQTCAPILR